MIKISDTNIIPASEPPSGLPKIYLISDSTGETLFAAVTAAMAQFEGADIDKRSYGMIRNKTDLSPVLDAISAAPGPVFYTIVNQELAPLVAQHCKIIGVPCIPVLQPLIETLSEVLNREISRKPGGQHSVDEAYFERISALDYAMALDDGTSTTRLRQADVVLVGVSRTSKTPTCIYLAYRGLKAANVPLVPFTSPPKALLDLDAVSGPLVVGLVVSPSRLVQIRTHRLEVLAPDDQNVGVGDYAEIESVRREVMEARRLFEQMDWPVIDVTRRSIEETAAEISILHARKLEGRI